MKGIIQRLSRMVQATFGVGRREANGFIILLPLIFILIFSQSIYQALFIEQVKFSPEESIQLDSLINHIQRKKVEDQRDSILLFPFDPNKSTINELETLGVPNYMAKRIEQYRLKGGRFYIKTDLLKMYNFDTTLYSKLAPYISLPDSAIQKTQYNNERPITDHAIEWDLNKADTTDLKSVYGVGSILAKRIIKYREGLGGFIDVQQLSEVFGLDSAVIARMKKFYVSGDYKPTQIVINKATVEELEAHPYLNQRQAKAIVTYRSQHGSFTDMNDLTLIKQLPASIQVKMIPYISFE